MLSVGTRTSPTGNKSMGKKAWMLLPYTPDPRWYNEGSTTPWYTTMQLFRQPKPYDWRSVGKALATTLTQLIKLK